MWHITLADPRGPLVGDRFMDSRLLLGTLLEDDSISYKDAMAFNNIPHTQARGEHKSCIGRRVLPRVYSYIYHGTQDLSALFNHHCRISNFECSPPPMIPYNHDACPILFNKVENR